MICTRSFSLQHSTFTRNTKKGASQARLAKQLGITQSYISAVISGSKSPSLELRNAIANILYGPYDEFLLAGRRIQNKLDPELNNNPEPDESVENLIARLTHYVVDHQRIEKGMDELTLPSPTYTKNWGGSSASFLIS